ncbi:phosphatidate cytidylyltransferase [Ottowia testudinis]|uniref:Phosphatidate cytidylyltransferase n=1 Tax=Ottowia testudinis TaxID=2816950 RepID=A0A975CIG4_9BURK|nr:phosphatidate cytidylyltransferase [Ottowia testudinis]QTD46416.1 phosphatidate cytidylyltransferase [Ottowia testudinis]
MLRQRIITALIMLAVLVAALWPASPVPFIALALVTMAAAAWEWARLNGVQGAGALAIGAAMVLACALAWWAGWVDDPFRAWWRVVALWVVVGGLLIGLGVNGWSRVLASIRLLLGLAALWVAWLAVVQARQLGVNFLLSVLALVAAADIAAYFAGRALGGKLVARKLAPSISPNKSWEGVFGGMAGVLLLAALWIAFDRQVAPANWGRSLYSYLWQGGGLALLVPSVMSLAGLSVVGDLVESLVKRAAGAKDSSQLLPGHGGVLDRIDAQLPTLPFAMALVTFVAQRVA